MVRVRNIKPVDKLFERQRKQLSALGYRMLGSMTEAEDVVQDGYLRWSHHWQKRDRESIDNPAAFLTSMVTRLCLDRLRHRKVERSRYIGPWLPEPMLTNTEADPLDRLELVESINTALLLVLESLSPLERAVFTLYEAFDYAHAEIAELLQISLSHSRQLLHRARRSLSDKTLASRPAGEESQPLVEAFYLAAQQGDMQKLTTILCDDVVSYSDGGGKASAAIIPLEGFDRVVTVFSHLIKQATADSVGQWCEVNGQHGLVIRDAGELSSVTTFDVQDGKIHRIYVMRNPDKLKAFLPL